MASRKEQKERLRREREEREQAAKEAERRKRLVGYGAGGALVAAVVIVLVLVLAGGGSDSEPGGSSSVLPGGGSVPDPKITDLDEAAKAAGCELKSFRAKSREHTADLAEQVPYESKPPTSGKHFQVPAEDGAYEEAPDPKELVHALEHGRVVIWFKRNLPKDDRADLKALFDEDTYQMLIAPDPTGMSYQVAATAWSGDPQPNGTGRLLGCPRMNAKTFDAIRAFKDEHRGNGPEAVP